MESFRLFCSGIAYGVEKGTGEIMTKKWVKAAAVRAVRTIAQTAVATMGTSAVLADVDWLMVVSASALAGILSLLTSVAGLPETKDERDA